jgi:hypothetical protein
MKVVKRKERIVVSLVSLHYMEKIKEVERRVESEWGMGRRDKNEKI